MLEACVDVLTLSTTIPPVPLAAFTAWETAEGNAEVMSKDMMHPAVPVHAPGLRLWFATLRKSHSLLVPLLKISVSGEQAAAPPASVKELPSVVPFMTPELLNPMRYSVATFEAFLPQA